MNFDEIKQNILNSSETSTSESESISGSELHEEFEINNFLPEFEPLKLSGKNLAQQYVSAFNTGMNVYQCLNYLQGYVYTLVTAMNETIEAWNTVVPLLEQATKEWTDEEFDYKWSILKPQIIELVTNLTLETFNNAWEKLKPVVIKLAQDTTDAEFKKQWDILKPQVITLVEETTTNKFNEEWEKLRPTIIQLSTDTTIEQFNRSWKELRPQVIELSQQTTSDKFDEKWEELRPQVIELAQTTTSNKFDEKWEALQPTLTETVNNLAKTQTTTTFNEKWEELRPQVIELAQNTTSTKFDEKWEELQPTLTETVNNLVNTNLDTFKSTLWQEVTKNNDFPFLLPENFGAVGDNMTDDSTAFNECFSASNDSGKPILLTRYYKIDNMLNDITGLQLYGINSGCGFTLGDTTFIDSLDDCYFENIFFGANLVNYSNTIFNRINSCLFKKCQFSDINFLCKIISISNHYTQSVEVLNSCVFNNTGIYINTSDTYFNNNVYINNCVFYKPENLSHSKKIIDGSIGANIYFNNCNIEQLKEDDVYLFNTNDNLIFNNCNIRNLSNYYMYNMVTTNNFYNYCIFNNCHIKANKLINYTDTNNFINIKIINCNLVVDYLLNATNNCNLLLENNIFKENYTLNESNFNINVLEITQKYNNTSENIYPWNNTQPTPTVENNVSLIKVGTTDYYVLTESKDKNIKKLDYYSKYDFDYIPDSPSYSTGFFVRNLDLDGYTVKKSLLTNNICKLKNKSTDELIDYVYFMLDGNVTVTTTKNNPQLVYTNISLKYLPYFAKLKTDTPIAGQCNVEMCISIILEKTSS